MGKIKIIFAIVVIYFIYKGFTAIMDFDLAVTEKVKKIEETFNDAIKKKMFRK